jgi:hypothetical protein
MTSKKMAWWPRANQFFTAGRLSLNPEPAATLSCPQSFAVAVGSGLNAWRTDRPCGAGGTNRHIRSSAYNPYNCSRGKCWEAIAGGEMPGSEAVGKPFLSSPCHRLPLRIFRPTDVVSACGRGLVLKSSRPDVRHALPSVGGCGKGDRHLVPERPFGCFAQKVPVTLSAGRERLR